VREVVVRPAPSRVLYVTRLAVRVPGEMLSRLEAFAAPRGLSWAGAVVLLATETVDLSRGRAGRMLDARARAACEAERLVACGAASRKKTVRRRPSKSGTRLVVSIATDAGPHGLSLAELDRARLPWAMTRAEALRAFASKALFAHVPPGSARARTVVGERVRDGLVRLARVRRGV
jgi:hypothetical protein